jgi:hypothetical protein
MAGRGHHHMPSLPLFGVIAVMADDKSRDAVIPGSTRAIGGE